MVEAHGQPGLVAQASPAGFVLGGLLLFRRKRPLLAVTLFTVVAIASTTVQVLVVPAADRSPNQVVPLFAIMVLSYSLGAFGSRRDLLLGLPQPLVVVVVNDLLQPSGNPIPGAVAFFAVFLVGAPALGGRLIRGRQWLLEALVEQRRQLDIQRAMQTRTALATERLRLAGRLHEDLVAGLDSLLTEIGVAEREGENLEAGSVAAIETQARTLLAQTRNVVVSLASESPGSATAVSNSAPTPGADPVRPARHDQAPDRQQHRRNLDGPRRGGRLHRPAAPGTRQVGRPRADARRAVRLPRDRGAAGSRLDPAADHVGGALVRGRPVLGFRYPALSRATSSCPCSPRGSLAESCRPGHAWSRNCGPTTSCSPGNVRPACVRPSRRNGPGSLVTCTIRSATT